LYNLTTQVFEYLTDNETGLDRPSGIASCDKIMACVDFGNNRVQIYHRWLALDKYYIKKSERNKCDFQKKQELSELSESRRTTWYVASKVYFLKTYRYIIWISVLLKQKIS